MGNNLISILLLFGIICLFTLMFYNMDSNLRVMINKLEDPSPKGNYFPFSTLFICNNDSYFILIKEIIELSILVSNVNLMNYREIFSLMNSYFKKTLDVGCIQFWP